MSMTQRLIANLNTLREAGAFTVNELAEQTGMHRTQLSYILNGRQKSITLDDAAAIAKAVGIDLAALTAGPIEVSAHGSA